MARALPARRWGRRTSELAGQLRDRNLATDRRAGQRDRPACRAGSGPDRVVFGTGMPFNSPDPALVKIEVLDLPRRGQGADPLEDRGEAVRAVKGLCLELRLARVARPEGRRAWRGRRRESPRPSLRSGRATRALWACHTTLPCAAHANPSGSPSTMGLRRGGPKNALGAACSPTRLPQNTAGKKTFSVDTVDPSGILPRGVRMLRLAHERLSLR